MCRSYTQQLEFVSENLEGGMENELLPACSVPFSKADTRRRMYRSSVLNHSCPVFKFPSAEGHSLATFAGDGKTLCSSVVDLNFYFPSMRDIFYRW